MKKLSIIIPIYNAENKIESCVKSIIENKVDKEEKIEILLINDGSSDNSLNKIKNLSKLDSRIKVIDKKNSGCSNTRNLGIALSNGEYIWFIDADDSISLNSLEKILKILNKKDKIDILIFGFSILNKNKLINKIFPKIVSNKFEIYNQMIIFNQVWNKVYRKDIILNNQIEFIENCHMGEDLVFNFKYFYYMKKFYFLSEILYNYYYEDGVSFNLDKRREIFLSLDEIINFFETKNYFFQMKRILRRYYIAHTIKFPYELILKYNTNKKYNEKIELLKIKKELEKRKKYFNGEFLIYQKFYLIKIKLEKILKKWILLTKNEN